MVNESKEINKRKNSPIVEEQVNKFMEVMNKRMNPEPLKGKLQGLDVNIERYFMEEDVKSAVELSIIEINNLIPFGSQRTEVQLVPTDVFKIIYRNFKDVFK